MNLDWNKGNNLLVEQIAITFGEYISQLVSRIRKTLRKTHRIFENMKHETLNKIAYYRAGFIGFSDEFIHNTRDIQNNEYNKSSSKMIYYEIKDKMRNNQRNTYTWIM